MLFGALIVGIAEAHVDEADVEPGAFGFFGGGHCSSVPSYAAGQKRESQELVRQERFELPTLWFEALMHTRAHAETRQ